MLKVEKLDIENLKETVKEAIKNIFVLTDNEKKFIDNFNIGIFDQKLLFENYNVNDLSNHPMVIWKFKNI